MSRIKIKNFGPIREGLGDEWMDVKKVTVLIGNQGSGKSTVAKLISTCSWLEKALYRKNIEKRDVTKSKFQNVFCGYQNLNNHFKNNTEIVFEGDYYTFTYNSHKGRLEVDEVKNEYLVPKIMYVPAERNFVSAVPQPDKLKNLPKPLYTFLDEYDYAKNELEDPLELPINHLRFQYDKKTEKSLIIGKDYTLPLHQASSGLQSVIPLFLVSKYLSEGIGKEADHSKSQVSLEQARKMEDQIRFILSNDELDNESKSHLIGLISRIFANNSCFINIVEEPEQNLFPDSQWELLKKLLEFNHPMGNRLVMTTHSPYLINYISIAIQAAHLTARVREREDSAEWIAKIGHIVPSKSQVSASDVVIYQLDEKSGTIHKLPNFEGIPSDDNYLNQSLRHGNEMFDDLLEIEQEL